MIDFEIFVNKIESVVLDWQTEIFSNRTSQVGETFVIVVANLHEYIIPYFWDLARGLRKVEWQ